MLEVRNILDITRCISLYTENTRPQPYRPGGLLASQCVLPTDWRVAVGVCWKLVGKISHKEGSAPKTSLLLLCPLVGTTAAYSLHGPWQLVYKHSMLALKVNVGPSTSACFRKCDKQRPQTVQFVSHLSVSCEEILTNKMQKIGNNCVLNHKNLLTTKAITRFSVQHVVPSCDHTLGKQWLAALWQSLHQSAANQCHMSITAVFLNAIMPMVRYTFWLGNLFHCHQLYVSTLSMKPCRTHKKKY